MPRIKLEITGSYDLCYWVARLDIRRLWTARLTIGRGEPGLRAHKLELKLQSRSIHRSCCQTCGPGLYAGPQQCPSLEADFEYPEAAQERCVQLQTASSISVQLLAWPTMEVHLLSTAAFADVEGWILIALKDVKGTSPASKPTLLL